MIKHGKAHGAGVDALEYGGPAAFKALLQGLTRLARIAFGLSGCQPAKHQNIVLRGVVVMLGQLVVQQVCNMKVYQLRAAQIEQGEL